MAKESKYLNFEHVQKEKNELDLKQGALKNFIASEEYEELSEEKRSLLFSLNSQVDAHSEALSRLLAELAEDK